MVNRKDILRRIRRAWVVFGGSAMLVFVVWSAWAYRATADAKAALVSDAQVEVVRADHHWRFAPVGAAPTKVGLLFFPGAMVDPAAYAPLARSIARAGYPVVLIELPRRGVLGGADGAEALGRAAMRRWSDISAWVVAGHSRGAVVAATLVHQGGPGLAGLVLMGTTHPRDFSLAETRIPVTKIQATKDGIAPVAASEENRRLLPASVRWVAIDGGNHSQFGYYGFQPGDRFAAVTREKQQEVTAREILSMLEAAAPR